MQVDMIALTHYHGDHIFGMPGLMQTLCSMGRTEPLYITGPEGMEEELAPILKLVGWTSYEIRMIEVPKDGLKLADQGADVILNLVTGAPSGVFQAAREREMYVVGIDTDQKINNPDYDNVILCSVKKNLGMSIYDAVMEDADEEIWRESEITVSGLKSGHVSLVYGSDTSIQLVSDEIKTAADELSQLIEAGEIKVKTAR